VADRTEHSGHGLMKLAPGPRQPRRARPSQAVARRPPRAGGRGAVCL